MTLGVTSLLWLTFAPMLQGTTPPRPAVTIQLLEVHAKNRTEEIDPLEFQASFDDVCPGATQTVHETKARFIVRIKYYGAKLTGNPLRNSYSYELFKRGNPKPIDAASAKIDGNDAAIKTLMTKACKIITSEKNRDGLGLREFGV